MYNGLTKVINAYTNKQGKQVSWQLAVVVVVKSEQIACCSKLNKKSFKALKI